MSAPFDEDDRELLAVVDAARQGDDSAFGRIVERFGPELRLHCYRLLGSFDDAEDCVQDVVLQAWRAIGGFEGRSQIRTWLYKIATRTCLARIRKTRRRRSLLARTTRMDGVVVPLVATVPWLQAFPDVLLDEVADRDPGPGGRLASRETVELAVIAAFQHLPPAQRAAVVLRDLVGWPAATCARELETTVAAVNGALRRGRATLREVLGPDRASWPAVEPTIDERLLVERYVDAIEAHDDRAIAALLRHDAVVSHQPWAGSGFPETAWYGGRDAIVKAWAPAVHGPLEMRMYPVGVNRQPAVATYARLPGSDRHRAFGLAVLHIEGSQVVEVTNLTPDQFGALGLPAELPGGPQYVS